jgi:hypothetical protein
LARPTHARSFHSGIDGESSGGDHAICFYENSDSEDIILDLSSFDDVDSQHESVLLLLGNVQYINGGGKEDPGMSDLALVLRGVGNGEQHEWFLGIVDGISKTQILELYDSVGDNFTLILNEES